MFGHKSDNQTTVGTATVQNPSMLDNVSSQDFDANGAESAGDVQQKVEEALNQHEMKKMMDSATAETPTAPASPFMSSPSAGVTPTVVASNDGSVPSVDPAVTPAPVASNTTAPSVPEEPVIQSVAGATDPSPEPAAAPEADIPRPLSPEENSEIEALPVVKPVAPGADVDSSPTAESPSAPIEPPSAPPVAAVPPNAPPPIEAAVTENVAENKSDDATIPDETSAEVTTEESAESNADASTTTEDATPEPSGEKSSEEPTDSSDSKETNTDTTEIEKTVEDPAPTDETSSDGDSSAMNEADVSVATVPTVDTDKLAGLKKHALEHLEPLADSLNQTPEEEFKTTMMRIQANDNHTLLDRALEAAKKITDDKERAKALLDIVNEINYFSATKE